MRFKTDGALQRYSALILLLLSGYLISMVLSLLLDMKADARQQYETETMQLNQYQSMIEQRPHYEAEHKRLIAQLANDKRFYMAKTTSLAVAEFQKDLQSIIQQSGANLLSMQVINIPDKVESEFTPVKMKLRLRVDNASLAQLLYRLESRHPVGFIDSLKIQYQPAQYRRNSKKSEHKIKLDTLMEYTVFISNAL